MKKFQMNALSNENQIRIDEYDDIMFRCPISGKLYMSSRFHSINCKYTHCKTGWKFSKEVLVDGTKKDNADR